MHYINYEENRRHGTEDFPLEFYAVNELHPRYNMPYHWHREAELLLIRCGTFLLSLDGTEYCLREGELCYIPGGVLHGGEPSDCTYECIDFDTNTLLRQTQPIRRYLHQIENDRTMIQPLFTRQQPEVLACAAALFEAARSQQPGWEMLALAGLFQFFGIVLQKQHYNEMQVMKDRQEKVQQIKSTLEYIEANYQQPISLEDLARTAGLSPKYFCRYFRMIAKRTPIDYLNYYRIERACYLLEQHKYSVTDIAYDCGFNDTSYFIRSFKKYKGVTPHQYAAETLPGK